LDDLTTRLPTLEAFDCPFADDEDNNDAPGPTPEASSSPDRGAFDQVVEDRGENTSSYRGATPVVIDDFDVQDGLLQPGPGHADPSARLLIRDHRIAKTYPIGATLEKQFNGQWHLTQSSQVLSNLMMSMRLQHDGKWFMTTEIMSSS